MNTVGKDDAGAGGHAHPKLLERKSVVMGMAASMGFVIANAAQPSVAVAGTVKPIAAPQPGYVPKWLPNTAYSLGQQVISPTNDVVSARVAHMSSSNYSLDLSKWSLSSTYATKIGPEIAERLPSSLAPVNVMSQGAVGDGSTLDTPAIKAAITLAKSEKRPLYFPPRQYVVDSQFDFSGLAVEGTGAELIRKGGIAHTEHLVTASTPFNLRGLTLNGNKAAMNSNDSRSAVACYSGAGFALYGVAIKDFFGYGILVDNPAPINVRGRADASLATAGAVILEGVDITNCINGAFIKWVRGVKVLRSTLSSNGEDGLNLYGCAEATVSESRTHSNGRHGVMDEYGYDNKITNNFCRLNAQIGIAIGGGDTDKEAGVRFLVSGNSCHRNTWHGIAVDTTKSGALSTPVYGYGTVSDNHCDGNTLNGLYIHNSGFVNVRGNHAKDNTMGGLVIDSYRCTLDDNHLTGNGKGLHFLAAQAGAMIEYGMHQLGSNIVTGNAVDYVYNANGWQGSAFRVSGTGSPDTVLSLPVGSLYTQTDGEPGSMLWIKRTGGTSAKGWVAIA